MNNKSKKKKLVLLLILVIGISIGYAAIATTLKINGTSIAKGQGWSVFWSNVNVTEGSVTGTNVTNAPTTVGTTTTEVEFAVTLPEPGDYYEFTIDAVNAGTIDAMIAEHGILNKVYSDSGYTTEATLPKALNYTITYADGTEIAEKHLLAKKSGNTPTTQKYKVRVEYRNDEEINPSDLDEENDKTYYFKFEVTYVQADDSASELHSAISFVKRQTEGQITPGDIIEIGGTEDFFVFKTDSEKTLLFARYDLLVGYESHDKGATHTLIDPNTPGYGLQSADAVSYDQTINDWKGMTSFATTNYWLNGNNLLSPYNQNNTIIYNSYYESFEYSADHSPARIYVYDENSTIYPYLNGENGYVNKLKALGAPSTVTARLLKIEESSMTSSIKYNGVPISINGQSYWCGSTETANGLMAFYPNGDLYTGVGYGISYGIRPVIEIPTSEIE